MYKAKKIQTASSLFHEKKKKYEVDVTDLKFNIKNASRR